MINSAIEAKQKQGMSILEEWLQEKYVENYDSVTEGDNGNEIEFLNRNFNYELLLKDGARDYIINEGKIYYLLNKNCSYIPKEIRESLVGGNTTEYEEYIRLKDVYGITRDLKVYYCNNGLEGVYGNLESYDIDPNAPATGVNGNNELKSALSDILKEKYGITTSDSLTLQNVTTFSDTLELDGKKYQIKNLTGLGDLKKLKNLTLLNLDLTSLEGIEGIPNLKYIYLKDTIVNDFKALSSCINLQYLYLYLPNTRVQDIANNQIIKLGEGLKNADKLTKLEYFGISRRYYNV